MAKTHFTFRGRVIFSMDGDQIGSERKREPARAERELELRKLGVRNYHGIQSTPKTPTILSVPKHGAPLPKGS